MTELSSPRPYLLRLPLEIRYNIYRYYFVPRSGRWRYRRLDFLLTCRQIYSEAHLIAFSGTSFLLSEWRDAQLSTLLSCLKPSTIAAIQTVEVEVESWNNIVEDDDPDYLAWLKRDDEAFFHEMYSPGEWIVKILGLFKGLKDLTLYSDGHGFVWEFSEIKNEIESAPNLGADVGGWSIGDTDEDIMLKFVLNRKEDAVEDGLEEREVVVWVQ